jgi:hypothetical protein
VRELNTHWKSLFGLFRGLVPLSPLITAWTYQHPTIGGSAAPFRAQAMGRFASGRYDALMEPWGLSRARPSTAVQCAPLRSARKEARDGAHALPAKRGISGCSDTKTRPSFHQRSEMP